jgi:hypothetical protein
MKHLKKFESFSLNEEEGSFRKFFTGHSDKTEKFGTMKTFLADLDKFEDIAAGNEDIVFNREKLIQQAKENNYKGHLEERDSRSGGTYIIYVTGASDFDKVASMAANRRDNPLGNG